MQYFQLPRNMEQEMGRIGPTLSNGQGNQPFTKQDYMSWHKELVSRGLLFTVFLVSNRVPHRFFFNIVGSNDLFLLYCESSGCCQSFSSRENIFPNTRKHSSRKRTAHLLTGRGREVPLGGGYVVQRARCCP